MRYLRTVTVGLYLILCHALVSNADELAKFFVERDRWLYLKAAEECPLEDYPDFEPQTMGTPIAEQLAGERQKLIADQQSLAELQKKIAKYKGKDGYKTVVDKYIRQAREVEAGIDKRNRAIAKLEKSGIDEQKKVDDFNQQQALAKERWEKDVAERKDKASKERVATIRRRFKELRSDLMLLPPSAPILSPDLKVGACGFLPRWPVGLAKSANPIQMQRLEGLCTAVKLGRPLASHEAAFLERFMAAEVLAAGKHQHNVRVVQVFDKQRLLAALIDGGLSNWPSFLLEIDDTSNYADDSKLTLLAPVMVSGTHRYEAVNGAARTAFVLRSLGDGDLPVPLSLSDAEIVALPVPVPARKQATVVDPRRADLDRRIEAEIERRQTEIESLEKEIADTESETKELKTKLVRLERAVKSSASKQSQEKTRRLIDDSKKELKEFERKIVEAKRKIQSNENAIHGMKRPIPMVPMNIAR